MSLNHQFFIETLEWYKEFKTSELMITKPNNIIKIHDDILVSMADELRKVPHVQFPNGRIGTGLDFFAYNLLGKESCYYINKLFISYIELINLGDMPFTVNSRKNHQSRAVEKEILIGLFKGVALFAEDVIENDNLYLIHLGI